MIIIDWQYMSEDAPVVSLGTCLQYNISSYLETYGSQSSNLYLNVAPFFNASVN